MKYLILALFLSSCVIHPPNDLKCGNEGNQWRKSRVNAECPKSERVTILGRFEL
jgi:hypothetical protein